MAWVRLAFFNTVLKASTHPELRLLPRGVGESTVTAGPGETALSINNGADPSNTREGSRRGGYSTRCGAHVQVSLIFIKGLGYRNTSTTSPTPFLSPSLSLSRVRARRDALHLLSLAPESVLTVGMLSYVWLSVSSTYSAL